MRQFATFDIGGTSIKYGILTENGEVLEKYSVPTEAHLGGRNIMEKIKVCVKQLREKNKIDGICISTAGQVDSVEGKILYASELIPNYTGTYLKSELEATFGLPVEVENDVNCMGLAESWVGAAKHAQSAFCLTVGTGIGGSFIMDGKLQTGHSFSAGEIGYIPINGEQFQELASTRTLVAKVAKRKGLEQNELNGEHVFHWAKEGDEICIEEIDQLALNLSRGLAIIAYVVNPEIIVIGGGITAQKEYLYPLIVKHLQHELIPNIYRNTNVQIADTLNDAGMIGALRHFLFRESLKPLQSVSSVIERNLHRLTGQEKRVADYMINFLGDVPQQTITEVSRKIGVSESTVTRFCKKLNFESFNNLRLMAQEFVVHGKNLTRDDYSPFQEVKNEYLSIINESESLFHLSQIQLLLKKVREHSFVYIVSSLAEETSARKLQGQLMKYGIPTLLCIGKEQICAAMNAVNEHTAIICLSEQQRDDSLYQLLTQCKSRGAWIATITGQYDVPITKQAHVSFVVANRVGSLTHDIPFRYFVDIIINELRKSVITA